MATDAGHAHTHDACTRKPPYESTVATACSQSSNIASRLAKLDVGLLGTPGIPRQETRYPINLNMIQDLNYGERVVPNRSAPPTRAHGPFQVFARCLATVIPTRRLFFLPPSLSTTPCPRPSAYSSPPSLLSSSSSSGPCPRLLHPSHTRPPPPLLRAGRPAHNAPAHFSPTRLYARAPGG